MWETSVLALIGLVALLVLGGAVFWLSRRRQSSFEDTLNILEDMPDEVTVELREPDRGWEMKAGLRWKRGLRTMILWYARTEDGKKETLTPCFGSWATLVFEHGHLQTFGYPSYHRHSGRTEAALLTIADCVMQRRRSMTPVIQSLVKS